MKFVMAVLMALSLVVTGSTAGSVQTAGLSSVATGMNSAAGWADDEGRPVANVMVTDVDPGWNGAESIRGEQFVAVDFAVENTYSTAIVIRPAGFSLVDTAGRSHESGQFRRDLQNDLFADEIDLAAGERVELTLVFALPDGVDPAVFQWTPGNGLNVIVDISDSPGSSTILADGLDNPVAWLDENGNEVGSLEVVGLDLNWLDADDYDGSGYDMTLLQVRYRFTNLSDSPQVVRGSGLNLVDSLGTTISSSGEHQPASDELRLEEEREVDAGESIEYTRVYGLLDNRELAYLMWSPQADESGQRQLAFIVLSDDHMVPATPVATPAQ